MYFAVGSKTSGLIFICLSINFAWKRIVERKAKVKINYSKWIVCFSDFLNIPLLLRL